MKHTALVAAALLSMAGSASAFDCAKAASDAEKLIYSDDALKAADDAMSSAYTDLRAGLDGKARKALARSQKSWLERRAGCIGDDTALACMMARTGSRVYFLRGEAESGPGIGKAFTPVFIQQAGTTKLYDLDYALLQIVEPKSKGERLFAAEVNKVIDGAPRGPAEFDAPEGMTLSSSTEMAVTYASPRLVSALLDLYSFEGGAHGNYGQSAINIDLAAGAAMKISDLFDASALKGLETNCMAQLMAQKRAKMAGEDYKPEEDSTLKDGLPTAFAEMSSWSFRAGEAKALFSPYVVGSYAEGSYECVFPMAELKAAARPDAPLPE
jgi:uncharacterized protein YecT (DUF1311 family)